MAKTITKINTKVILKLFKIGKLNILSKKWLLEKGFTIIELNGKVVGLIEPNEIL